MSASPTARGSRVQRGGASRSNIPALTGLRAVAALLVVGTHAAFATGALTHGYLGAIFARLEIGVAIFFALSGFLLFRPWVIAATTATPPPSLARYARHRFRRIMPAYVVAVLATFGVYTVFTPGPNPGQTWHGLVRYLTLTQIYTDNYLVTLLHPGLSQMWSLAVEASFYAALPALAWLVLRRGARPSAALTRLAAMAAVTPAWLIVAHTTDLLPNSAGTWLPAHIACFVGGMTLAVLAAIGTRWRVGVTLPVAAALYLAVATPIGGAILGGDPAWVPVTKALFYASIAMLVVGTAVLGPASRYTRILGSRPMVRLGEISYEIFLLHVAVMAVVMSLVLRWPLFTGSLVTLYLVTLGVTIPLAWTLHRFTSSRSAGTSSVNARPLCDAASFSSAVSSAAVRVEPVGTNTGS
ncbi:acyltransferase [Mycobacteriaceae bacterium 1482268.1]|nr:acyltransferase [Mycobacteriaceae bacterium 1482268.1]